MIKLVFKQYETGINQCFSFMLMSSLQKITRCIPNMFVFLSGDDIEQNCQDLQNDTCNLTRIKIVKPDLSE